MPFPWTDDVPNSAPPRSQPLPWCVCDTEQRTRCDTTGSSGRCCIFARWTCQRGRAHAGAHHPRREAGCQALPIELLGANAQAPLVIGSYPGSKNVPARLLPNRFNRHTFWCVQSGSGKTCVLGVVLEQLLVYTGLPMVAVDQIRILCDFPRKTWILPVSLRQTLSKT